MFFPQGVGSRDAAIKLQGRIYASPGKDLQLLLRFMLTIKNLVFEASFD